MPLVISSSTRSKTHSNKRSNPPSLKFQRINVGHFLARLTLVASGLSFIIALIMATLSANALTAPIVNQLNNASKPAWGDDAQTSIGIIAGNIILAALGLLGVVFVVLLTYGGFLWLSAGGEEEKVKKAQALIFNSIVGALIVIAAYTIAWYVLQKLGAEV